MDFNQDFKDFLNANEDVRSAITQNIFNTEHQQLQIFPYYFFGKIFFIHIIMGTLTLLACPQFGLGFLSHHSGLMAILMQYGHTVCAAVCGSIFLGSTSLGIYFVLNRGEKLYLKHHHKKIFAALGTLSLAIFIGLQQTFAPTEFSLSFEYSLIWLLSGVGLTCIIFYSLKNRSLAS